LAVRHSVPIERRFLALIGAIALSFAYLPQVVSALGADAMPSCCAGMLCPMHHLAGGHMNCDMDPAHRGTTCEACAPHHPLPYTAGAVFNRVAPLLLAGERPAGAAPLVHLIVLPSLEPEVVSPPPRLALS
jgi:hypothetical protein